MNPSLQAFNLAALVYPEPQDDTATMAIVEILVANGYRVVMQTPTEPVAIAAMRQGQTWAVTAPTRYRAVVELCAAVGVDLE